MERTQVGFEFFRVLDQTQHESLGVDNREGGGRRRRSAYTAEPLNLKYAFLAFRAHFTLFTPSIPTQFLSSAGQYVMTDRVRNRMQRAICSDVSNHLLDEGVGSGQHRTRPDRQFALVLCSDFLIITLVPSRPKTKQSSLTRRGNIPKLSF